MVKEINGYKVRVNVKEGMKYVKVLKENRFSQEFISKSLSEEGIEKKAKRMVEELDKVKFISEEEIKESKRAERGFYQVLAEDKGIVFDKKKFYKYGIRLNRALKEAKKLRFSILCPKELRKEIVQELDEEDIAKKG